MRITLIFLLVSLVAYQVSTVRAAVDEDDDFAEFEEFDDDELVPQQPKEHQQQQHHQDLNPVINDDFPELEDDDDDGNTEDGIVEDDNEEFEHFQDEEEFEGFPGQEAPDVMPSSKEAEPKLQMAKVPLHFRTHWDSYWLEMLMIAGLLSYAGNYIVGKTKNAKLVNNWLAAHKTLLEENFCLVGDDGKLENESHGLMKEAENHYTLWCSGRTCCEGMLVELKLIKRQDLVSIIAGLLKPVQDQLILKIELSKDIFDTFVFAVATKKTAVKMFKEQADLNKFCTLVNKSDEKYKVPVGFTVLSEIQEASSAVLDSRLTAALNKYAAMIEYIHISDQYSGAIQQEDPGQLKQPEVKRMLIAAFNLPKSSSHSDGDDNEAASKPLLILAFYLMERLKRFRLSKESKQKADKNRQRVEEQFLKSTHAARAEAAALRREEKRKQEKERVLAEEDPEKQRRWEKKEQKRELKKKAPRMKKLSIKAM